MARDNWSGSFFLLSNTLFNLCNSPDHRKTESKNNIALCQFYCQIADVIHHVKLFLLCFFSYFFFVK